MSGIAAGRRLSVFRLLTLVAVVAALVFVSLVAWDRNHDAAEAQKSRTWFGSYVDATSTPFYDIGAGVAPGDRVVLSFVVAHPEDECAPSWGAYYTLDEAAETFDLDRKAARARDAGAQIVISTGGLLNDEPATACEDVVRVKDVYAAVLDRYDSAALDLDIEGDDLADVDAGVRRAEAVALLQEEAAAEKKPVEVWLTLPAATFGLTEEGLAEVGRMLDAEVDLAGVNLMTMNYGGSRAPGDSMGEASIQAAESAHAQLIRLYSDRGADVGEQSMWRRIGMTPMLGQNDLIGEVFEIADAEAVSSFAAERGIGRISLWSANRDAPCGPNFPDLTRVSNNCSGTAQAAGDFARALSPRGGQGEAAPAKRRDTGEATPVQAPQETQIADDPETSPYPIWSEEGVYVKGDRTVWRQNVYEAKWWNQGTLPDAPVAEGSATPWKLVGPVLPGDEPPADLVLPAGTYPEWDSEKVYLKADRIMFEGRVLESRWWNTADSPEAALQGSTDSPWKMLNNVEVQEILDERAASASPSASPSATPSPSTSPSP